METVCLFFFSGFSPFCHFLSNQTIVKHFLSEKMLIRSHSLLLSFFCFSLVAGINGKSKGIYIYIFKILILHLMLGIGNKSRISSDLSWMLACLARSSDEKFRLVHFLPLFVLFLYFCFFPFLAFFSQQPKECRTLLTF